MIWKRSLGNLGRGCGENINPNFQQLPEVLYVLIVDSLAILPVNAIGQEDALEEISEETLEEDSEAS